MEPPHPPPPNVGLITSFLQVKQAGLLFEMFFLSIVDIKTFS